MEGLCGSSCKDVIPKCLLEKRLTICPEETIGKTKTCQKLLKGGFDSLSGDLLQRRASITSPSSDDTRGLYRMDLRDWDPASVHDLAPSSLIWLVTVLSGYDQLLSGIILGLMLLPYMKRLKVSRSPYHKPLPFPSTLTIVLISRSFAASCIIFGLELIEWMAALQLILPDRRQESPHNIVTDSIELSRSLAIPILLYFERIRIKPPILGRLSIGHKGVPWRSLCAAAVMVVIIAWYLELKVP